MKLNLIALAIPFFLIFIWLEYYFSFKLKKGVYHFDDAISNLNVGISERLTDLLTTGAFYFVFAWINAHYSLCTIPANIYTWVLLFLLTDLIWYWYHRFGHTVNLFWSAHVVHHQSEDFNFTVSARITIFQAVIRGVFWAILPFIGFDAHMVVVILLIHGAYPFFTHTQLVGKLGWLEYVIVTPSHHRVHYSSNPAYVDKNYGDMLIIWDKIFGTFAQEDEQPAYGLTKPLNSHSFLWQHFHFILEMGIAFRLATGWKEKMKVILGRPDDINPRIRPYLEKKLLQQRSMQRINAQLRSMICFHTVLTLLVLFLTILFSYYISAFQLCILSLFILTGLVMTGAMLEQKKWSFPLEMARLSLAGIFLCSLIPSLYMVVCIVALLSGMLLFYQKLYHSYCQWLYRQFS